MPLLSEWKSPSLLVKFWDFDLKTVKYHYGQLSILFNFIKVNERFIMANWKYGQAISGTGSEKMSTSYKKNLYAPPLGMMRVWRLLVA